MAKVYVNAVAAGTTALKDGSIVHFDPEHTDERAHGGAFEEADADTLVKAGIGEIDKSKKVTEKDGNIIITAESSGMDLSRIEGLVQDRSEDDDEMRGPSPLNTASTIAFPAGHVESSGLQDSELSPSASDLSPALRAQAEAEAKDADEGAAAAKAKEAASAPAKAPAKKASAPAKAKAPAKKAAPAPAPAARTGLGSGKLSGTAGEGKAAEGSGDASGDEPPA